MAQAAKHSSYSDQAGEYVLGTLTGSEREQFELRMQSDHRVQAEVYSWNRRLQPLLDMLKPVTPPRVVWQRIQHRLKPQHVKNGLWDSLRFWRNLGLVAATLVLGLGLGIFGLRQDLGKDRVMMIASNDRQHVEWVVAATGQDDMLHIKAIAPPALAHGLVCHLWMETADGMFKAVGVLPHSGSKMMLMPARLQDNNGFKVSVELENSLPNSGPSGPVIFSGKMTRI